jgi:hypothetical protein
MDNRKKVFKHGGRLRIVLGLFEITAIYVHYRIYLEYSDSFKAFKSY